MAANTHSLDLESGSTQYAYVADTVPLSITGNMSMAGWIHFESLTGGEMTIAGKYDSGQTSYLFLWNDTGDNYQLYINATNVNWNILPSTATWYHFAVRYNASAGSAELFINNVSQGTQTGLPTAIDNTTARFALGRYFTSGTPSGPWDGLMDEIVVTSDMLSDQEIADLYAGWDATEKLDNIAGYWKLNNDYTDSSGNGATLTASGSPVFSTTVPFANYATAAVAVALALRTLLGVGT